MKLIGWAIVLAAAGLTPAAAQAPQGDAPVAASAAAPPTPAQPALAQVTVPTPGIGVPDGRKGIQEQVTEIGREAQSFHDNWLLVLCAVISIFVLGLLGYTMVRYRRGAHPEPTRNSHNTTLEIIWTLVPVLILVAIAIPSIRLLRHQYSPPPADLTVKAIGNQWYWSYEYPDHGVTFDSYMLKEGNDPTRQPNQRARTDADGPPLLATDERLVIPVGKVVKFIVTSNDVIHAFWVPAFWNKIDANPGQLNEIWAKVDRPGVYFGQCTELCGARHAYMPIAVEVVSAERFAAWVASKGGTMPGARPPATPDSTGASPVSEAAVPTAAQPQPNAGPAAADPAAVRQPAINQAATAQN
ncbi:MAG TPA: cytochrome c oxidase subunit II [Sphingomicrobium sp.]|nr:cytochrome c oxidase subunit II [Sphingomicrobium sp.]